MHGRCTSGTTRTSKKCATREWASVVCCSTNVAGKSFVAGGAFCSTWHRLARGRAAAEWEIFDVRGQMDSMMMRRTTVVVSSPRLPWMSRPLIVIAIAMMIKMRWLLPLRLLLLLQPTREQISYCSFSGRSAAAAVERMGPPVFFLSSLARYADLRRTKSIHFLFRII